MNIPTYNKRDLQSAEQDGNVDVIEFSEFISQLIEQDLSEHPAEKGIITHIHQNGTEGLSSKQLGVMNGVVNRYDKETCKICGDRIPLNRVFDFKDEADGLCDYHRHVQNKD